MHFHFVYLENLLEISYHSFFIQSSFSTLLSSTDKWGKTITSRLQGEIMATLFHKSSRNTSVTCEHLCYIQLELTNSWYNFLHLFACDLTAITNNITGDDENYLSNRICGKFLTRSYVHTYTCINLKLTFFWWQYHLVI